MRNAGVKKEVAGENGQTTKTAITATDVDGTTSDNALRIQDTAKFFKAKASGGSNLIEFKLTADYIDSNGEIQSEDLALNPDKEYITADDYQNNAGLQEGNTYQIINKNDSHSKLYWGSGADANKLIFEIPISTPYINEEYITDKITEQLDGNKNSKGITYTLDGGKKTAEVLSYDDSGDNVIIPDYVKDTTGNTYTVTSIGERAFQGCSGLTSVKIPDKVESMGKYAFFGCSGLTSVKIPDSVTSIGNSAFASCSGLTSVKIPDKVESMGGEKTFENCSNLTSVKIGNGVKSIGFAAFENCSKLENVKIPDKVKNIGQYAFKNCSKLESVTIGDDVREIGESAFFDCSGLTSVKIPDSVTSMGVAAFKNCSKLESVTIGDGVTSISAHAFCNCGELKSVTMPGSVESISNDAFRGCSKLESVVIPDSVTSIGKDAFNLCSNLKTITIKSENFSGGVGDWAFDNLPENGIIYIPDSKINDTGYQALFTGKGLPSGWTFKKLSEKPAK